mmetsp:Transcript_19425/g.41827  ORF Transcript_19425/g.41827 Transcript_19425/m.41827 type:complete len:137 (-) Transcript_19425:304-714(-)
MGTMNPSSHLLVFQREFHTQLSSKLTLRHVLFNTQVGVSTAVGTKKFKESASHPSPLGRRENRVNFFFPTYFFTPSSLLSNVQPGFQHGLGQILHGVKMGAAAEYFECFRLYDSDRDSPPEYAFAIDCYGEYVQMA